MDDKMSKPRLTWAILWEVEGYAHRKDRAYADWEKAVVFVNDEYDDSSFVIGELCCALAIELGRMDDRIPSRLCVLIVDEGKRGDVDISGDDLVVLFDQSGECDDVAIVKSDEVEVSEQYDDEYGGFCHVAPRLGNIRISGERAGKIAKIVEVGLFEKLQEWAVKPDAQEYHPSRPSADCLRELVEAFTFGRRTVGFENGMDGYNDFVWDPSVDYYEEAAVGLVLGGYVDADERIVEMARLYREMDDVIEMWEKTFEKCGVPFALRIDEDASDFEEEDAEPPWTNVRAEGICAIGAALGIDSMMDAYFSGVSADDIMA